MRALGAGLLFLGGLAVMLACLAAFMFALYGAGFLVAYALFCDATGCS